MNPVINHPLFKTGETKVSLFTDTDLAEMQKKLTASIYEAVQNGKPSIVAKQQPGVSNHTHGYATGVASGGSYHAIGGGTSNPSYTQGTGTWTSPGIWDSGTTYTRPVDPGPSWQELMKSIIEAAVNEVAKEVTETLKDLQEQIDEIWESLQDE